MNKYARICWNTKFWHEPTGEAAKLELAKTYVRKNGFGLEEWLFNFAWLQPGSKNKSQQFRYGFLQPIGKFRSKYQGQTFDVFLYTVTPNRKRLGVGIIRELYVPMDDELAEAHEYMRRRGWLDEMASDITALGLDARALNGPPEDIINVRFEESKVRFFDPRLILPKRHVTSTNARYHPFNWTSEYPGATRTAVRERGGRRKSANKKSERDRTRAAIEGTTYSPRHNILQNALDKFLRRLYGQNAVKYENDFVDVQLHRENKIIFFEIKMGLTAKSCIREALGQLFEYSLYPARRRATEMVVVGEAAPTRDDIAYVSYLRSEFGIPVRYIRWNWGRKALEGDL